uniref:Uncharacterized protein n=1 Tax=Siphoviridae sp. ctDhw1 TaxID=2827813 RepID=A0A8S5SIR2_9CAUD|nr:MAG TPA: hypothetical protein [Siphoviridae sp. ctDhw1]DAO99964.1 MAG TPA: hypothetical protein [Caudoviricetes sp.]
MGGYGIVIYRREAETTNKNVCCQELSLQNARNFRA